MNQVQALEEQLKTNAELIKLGDAIDRLLRNADFKEVIIENFSTRDCARYARESVDPALTAEQRADALAFAQAAGYLKQWLAYQMRFADNARNEKVELDDAISAARAEEDGGQ